MLIRLTASIAFLVTSAAASAQTLGVTLDSALDMRPPQVPSMHRHDTTILPYSGIKGPTITVQPMTAEEQRALEAEAQRQAAQRAAAEKAQRRASRPRPKPVQTTGHYAATIATDDAAAWDDDTPAPATAAPEGWHTQAVAPLAPAAPPAPTPPVANNYAPVSGNIVNGILPERACNFHAGLYALVPKQPYAVRTGTMAQCETDWVPISEGQLRYLARGNKDRVYHLQLNAKLTEKQHIIGNATFRAAVKNMVEKALPYSLADEVFDAIEAETPARWMGDQFEIIFEKQSTAATPAQLTFILRKTKY